MTLIDRLSKLDGPDREVDAEIALQNGWQVFTGDNWIGPEAEIVVPDYTRSVDAAIALARRLWPDVMYRVGNHAEGYDPSLYLGEIFIAGDKRDSYLTGVASSAAIALCIAILRTKEASSHGE